ncbi:hypothetical protein [Streptomyces sp. B1I3]|uniref:hypothetical protein n=1 Tax=Streptomyces sp. B1I3 TaxID=3042264 RepID=UPI0027819369|nr:hypothetical protein [Streptomyces sp. B1I3]MDQ0795635.1 hypothetical protein [Streptomyces sp. B1I3]
MRPRLRPAAVLAALLPLAACGIQETDVIGTSGPAAIDVLPARQDRMLLFFLSPDGALVPVPRTVGDGAAAGFGGEYTIGTGGSGSVDPADPDARQPTGKTLAALAAGPQEAERRAGLRNDPSLSAVAARIRVSGGGGTADVVVPGPIAGLTGPARRQLVCTVAYAEDADGRVTVRLRGTDGAPAPERCDTWPTRTPAQSTPGADPG